MVVTVMSQILYQLQKWCGLKSLTFADSKLLECRSLKDYAGIKQAHKTARFWGQNKLLGKKDLFLLWYMFKTNFSGHNKILGAQKY